MKFLYSDEPIIASSTCNHANAALAVLRISGFKDFSQLKSFFTLDPGPIEPRKVYYTKLVYRGAIVDDICLTYFKGPHSYNGENILELSVHGNTLNVERIIQLFTEHGGCRTAQPGEFTYRALKNKKLNLAQVEGLDLFLNANSGYALEEGLSLLAGNLKDLYQDLWEQFLKHKASLELSIDFSDDVGEEAAKQHFDSSLKSLRILLEKLKNRVLPMEQNLIQPELVLAGLPNSGKSSLFNFILKDDRAIVSSVAGTTRDYITESIVIEGVKYRLVDTAGIRHSSDEIESEGIRRSISKLGSSFYTVLLINPFESGPELAKLLAQKYDLAVFTHADVTNFDHEKSELLKRHPQLGSIGAIALNQEPRTFENLLYSNINKKYLDTVKDKPILLDRHKGLILQAYDQVVSYEKTASYEKDVAILSSELNTLGHCLSELIGIVSPDQILNSIFSNFCIGK